MVDSILTAIEYDEALEKVFFTPSTEEQDQLTSTIAGLFEDDGVDISGYPGNLASSPFLAVGTLLMEKFFPASEFTRLGVDINHADLISLALVAFVQENPTMGSINQLSTELVQFFGESHGSPIPGFDLPEFDLGTGFKVSDYEDLYNVLLTNVPLVPPLNNLLTTFINKMVTEKGYFLPSHFANEWILLVKTTFLAYTTPGFGQLLNPGSLVGVDRKAFVTKSKNIDIIFRIFALLTQMMDVLQAVASTQALRLLFYAEYQKAYTDLIAKIPTLRGDQVNLTGLDNNQVQQVLGRIQEKTQEWTEKLRAFRSVIADEAKGHQSAVNQSKELVNQQASLASTILQQLAGMLQSIYR